MNYFRRSRNKFGAQRSGDFPSKLEAAVYELLLLREKAKEIKEIKRQVRVELSRAAIASKIDFGFTYVQSNSPGFAEAKGVETERWTIIKKLWRFYGPAPLEIFKGTYNRPQLVEIIEPEE